MTKVLFFLEDESQSDIIEELKTKLPNISFELYSDSKTLEYDAALIISKVSNESSSEEWFKNIIKKNTKMPLPYLIIYLDKADKNIDPDIVDLEKITFEEDLRSSEFSKKDFSFIWLHYNREEGIKKLVDLMSQEYRCSFCSNTQNVPFNICKVCKHKRKVPFWKKIKKFLLSDSREFYDSRT